MEVLKNNKGLIIFYLFMSVIMTFWVCKVDRENDVMTHQKNTYILNSVNN